MHRVIRAGELQPSPSGTVRFEGEAYGSGVSLILVRDKPGGGPRLHKHPYSETWVVQVGRALFTAGNEEVEAGPGDIVVVGPETPHKFKNTGDALLELLCIHPSPRIIQTWLEN